MEQDPSKTSSAYNRMAPTWRMIDDILAGPAQIRAAGTLYLPMYAAEGEMVGEYDRRKSQAPWRPEFEDILRSLASKPFTREVGLGDGASPEIEAIAEDVDAKGNNLTVFARSVFRHGIARGLHGILVDFPKAAGVATLADERMIGARPYWVSIKAEDILALYTEFRGGREVITHLRLRECVVERDGFAERTVERVRILEPGTWQIWEKSKDQNGKPKWDMIEEGATAPLQEVPLALFWTGEREGSQFVRAPLAALADMQIELYRALSRQEEVLTYTGSPMLVAQGLAPPGEGETLKIGPKQVLFAPATESGATGWSYIQPDANNLAEIREQIQSITDEMRRLGMQPLTQKSGGVTATASSVEAAKAHSTVEAWAIALKDVLEQAFVFTAQWLNQPADVEVEICTDFNVGETNQAALDALNKARAAKDISRNSYLAGLQRFDVLPPDFDASEDEIELAEEMQGLEPEAPMDPATGEPLQSRDPAEEARNSGPSRITQPKAGASVNGEA